jgi:hypothetical protein
MMLGFHFLCQKTFRNFLPPQLMSTIKQVPHGYILSFNQTNHGYLMYVIVLC